MTGRAGEWGRGCCWQGVVGAGLACRSGYHAVLAVNDALRSLARRLRRSSIIDGCAAAWGAGTGQSERTISYVVRRGGEYKQVCPMLRREEIKRCGQ